MFHKKLSIITINYNNVDGLKRTVESVFNQTWRDFEYIVIDGDSTDGSKEYIQENAECFDKWVSDSDRGIYHAMNKGIEYSRGDFLFFLNSGDLLIDSLDKCITHLDYNNSIFCFRYYIEENRSIYKSETNKKDLISLLDDMINHQSIIYRKDCFMNHHYDESYQFCADYKHLLSCLLEGKKIKNIDEFLSVFNLNGISSLDKNQENIKSERFVIQKELMNENLFDLWNEAFFYKQELNQIKKSRIFKFLNFILFR
jgi:glycosyltransferase involved in cell wall biosynthesis